MSLYAERLKSGDKVMVIWGNTAPEPATIITMPRGAGDLIQVKYDDGIIQAINPYHSSFVGLQKNVESEFD